MRLYKILTLSIFVAVVLFLAMFTYLITTIDEKGPEVMDGAPTPEIKTVCYLGNDLSDKDEYDLMKKLRRKFAREQDVGFAVLDGEGDATKQLELFKQIEAQSDIVIVNPIHQENFQNTTAQLIVVGDIQTNVLSVAFSKQDIEAIKRDKNSKHFVESIGEVRTLNAQGIRDILLMSSDLQSLGLLADGSIDGLIFLDNTQLAEEILLYAKEMLTGAPSGGAVRLSPQYMEEP